jgi:hypothetical protein
LKPFQRDLVDVVKVDNLPEFHISVENSAVVCSEAIYAIAGKRVLRARRTAAT